MLIDIVGVLLSSYVIIDLLCLVPRSRKGVKLMLDIWSTFWVSVAASVAGYYICKWLDRHF